MNFTRRSALVAGAALTMPGAAWALDSATFPFRVTRNRPWTVVAINNQEPPLPFLLSTGSGWYAISDSAAKSLKLPRADKSYLKSPVDRMDIPVYRIERAKIGGVMEERDIYLAGLPDGRVLDNLKGVIPPTSASVMSFDFDRLEIAVSRSLTAKPEGYRALPLELGVQLQGGADPLGAQARTEFSQANLDLTPTVVAELDGEPVKLKLSTGYSGGLFLHSSYVQAKGLWDHYPTHVAQQHLSPTGLTVNSRLVRAERLKLGGVVFQKPVVHLSDPQYAAHDVDGIEVGFVGMEFLRRFNLVYDPFSRLIWLKPNAAIADGYHYNRAGADVELVNGRLLITELSPGGPADRAGLKEGDVVTGWRGPDGYDGLVWALTGAPGSTVDIQVSRGGKAELVSVVLEDHL